MQIQFKRKSAASNCSIHVSILAFLWTAGLVLGHIVGRGNDTFLSLMRTVPDSRVTIVGFLTAYFLPFLVSIAAVFSKTTVSIYGCTLIRGSFSGALMACLYRFYGSAAWLVSSFLLANWAVSIMLLWLYSQDPNRSGEIKRKQITACAGVLIMIAALDYLFIAPFWAMIIG